VAITTASTSGRFKTSIGSATSVVMTRVRDDAADPRRVGGGHDPAPRMAEDTHMMQLMAPAVTPMPITLLHTLARKGEPIRDVIEDPRQPDRRRAP
jgi:hypothetical protein